MLTYFVIGIVMQLIVIIERAIRFPLLWKEGYNHWQFWAVFIVNSIINALVWPITVVCEIFNVAIGQ